MPNRDPNAWRIELVETWEGSTASLEVRYKAQTTRRIELRPGDRAELIITFDPELGPLVMMRGHTGAGFRIIDKGDR